MANTAKIKSLLNDLDTIVTEEDSELLHLHQNYPLQYRSSTMNPAHQAYRYPAAKPPSDWSRNRGMESSGGSDRREGFAHPSSHLDPQYPSYYNDIGRNQADFGTVQQGYNTASTIPHDQYYTHPDRIQQGLVPPTTQRRVNSSSSRQGFQGASYLDREALRPQEQAFRSEQEWARGEDLRQNPRQDLQKETSGKAKGKGTKNGRVRTKNNRGKKGGQQQQQNQQQSQQQSQRQRTESLPPRSETAEYEYRLSSTEPRAENTNVNSIAISDANNRLRSRLPLTIPLRALDISNDFDRRSLEPESYPSHQEQFSPQYPRYCSPSLSPSPPPSPTYSQHMSTANGGPIIPTGPAAGPGGAVGAPPRRLQNHVQIADAYIFQQIIDDRLKKIGVTQAREDALRLAGVQWIDQVRKALKLPVKTFDTACVYYHKFRLMHGDNEYAYVDASAAALFAACKIEDTLKKSRDILCAAHNLKAPTRDQQLSPDDPQFESSSRTIVGHERLMLEASGFDFRSRHPQVVILKLLKEFGHEKESEVSRMSFKISLDLYRTMAPLKQCTAGMAFATVELAERLMGGGKWDEKRLEEVEGGYRRWGVKREMVVETLLDLLDIYTSYRTSTALGPSIPLDTFLQVRIPLNNESARRKLPRFTEYVEPETPSSATRPNINGTNTSSHPTGPRDSRDNRPTGPGGRRNDHNHPNTPNGNNHNIPNGTAHQGTASARSSKNTSPNEVDNSSSPNTTTGGSASTAATGISGGVPSAAASAGVPQPRAGQPGAGPQIRQRASERGREGTVRFMLNPERERSEKAVVESYGEAGLR